MENSEREGKLLRQFHAEEHPLESQFHFDDEVEEENDLKDKNEKGISSSIAQDDNGVDEESEDDERVAEGGEKFEHLEHDYEALVAEKRQALALGDISVEKSWVEEDTIGATMEEKSKRRGRTKGSRNKDDPELQRKVGDALLLHMNGDSEKAIRLLHEVIRFAPALSDPYRNLGLIYKEMGDKQRSIKFYTIAAHLSPKEAPLWKLLVELSTELDDLGQARYFLRKAIAADPKDINTRFHLASLYYESGEYVKAAEALEQISQLSPEMLCYFSSSRTVYRSWPA